MRNPKIKYYLILKKTGDAICILKQLDTDDSIGDDAHENMAINSIVVIGGISSMICKLLTIDVVLAPKLERYLLDNGITPY